MKKDSTMSRQAKWVIGGVGVVMLAAIVVSVIFLVRAAIYSGRVNILVTPSMATVQVGEEVYGAMGEHEVQPGEYVVKITAPGFEERTGRLTVGAGATVEVTAYLDPVAGNENWYDEHPEDALVLGEIKNAERLGEVRELMKKEPVLTELPRTVEYFTEGYRKYVKYVISYEFDDSEAGYHLIVKDYTGGNLVAAQAWVLEKGVDLEMVGLMYEDLTGEEL